MMCQFVTMDRRRCCIIERASCHALLYSLLSVVSAIAMGQCSSAVTGDHVVTTCGFVTLPNAGNRYRTHQLGILTVEICMKQEILENLYLQVFCFSSGLCLISFISLFPFHSESQRHITCHYVLRPLKQYQQYQANLLTNSDFIYQKNGFQGNLFPVQKREEKYAVHQNGSQQICCRRGSPVPLLYHLPSLVEKMEPFQRLCMVQRSNPQLRCAS